MTTTSSVENLVVTTAEVTTSEHGGHLPTTRWMGTNPCEQSPNKGNPGGVAQKMLVLLLQLYFIFLATI